MNRADTIMLNGLKGLDDGLLDEIAGGKLSPDDVELATYCVGLLKNDMGCSLDEALDAYNVNFLRNEGFGDEDIAEVHDIIRKAYA